MKKRFKLGFNLSEMLVALTIVGVITAMIIPTVVSSTQNRKNGAALGRSVEAIESGCQMMIQEMNERQVGIMFSGKPIFFGHFNIHRNLKGGDTTLPNSSVSGINLFRSDQARDFFKVTSLTPDSAYRNSVKNIGGGNASPTLSNLVYNGVQNDNSGYALNSKTGAYFGVQRPSAYENVDDPIVGFIYIDVNGASRPNQYGRDIFYFGLTDRCHMIPAGSDRLRTAISPGIILPTEAAGCAGNNPTNGLSCTSRVVNSGYKIEY